ncbi:MAG: YjiH family protein [Peptoniphilaceae bacterium]
MKIEEKPYSVSDILKFVIPSLIGVLLLMVPFVYEGKTTIVVALLSEKLIDITGNILPTLVLIFISITGIVTFLHRIKRIEKIEESEFLSGIFNVSFFWLIIRIIGMILAYLVYFSIGPEAIISENTGSLILFDLIKTLFTMFLFAGSLILFDLIKTLFTMFLFAGFLLPFLTDFGLLEFVGALFTPLMRPLFHLPGRSSIDCMASWVGDGTIGVALTNKQYVRGFYSAKEASIISTTFSAVSITFCLVVLGQVDLVEYFAQYYLTIILCGFIAALIVPRIPPLSKKENVYYNGEKKDLGEDVPKGYTARTWGLKLAVERARENANLKSFLGNGVKTVLDMWLGVLPTVMAFGTIGLLIAEFTPVFDILGKPFIPLLNLLNVEYALEASRSIMVGFADMFIPSVLGSTIPSEMTRFIVATLSVTQLVYLSEAGAVILGSKIPITPLDLFIIYIERTLITLPIIIMVSHIIF